MICNIYDLLRCLFVSSVYLYLTFNVVHCTNTTLNQRSARENGYIVSPRGTGHSYQSLSTLDGALVIDVSLNCKYDDSDGGFKVNYDDQGDHILPGSRYISTMRIPSGCTNAVLLAKTHDTHDKEEGAMCITGSCPSVGEFIQLIKNNM